MELAWKEHRVGGRVQVIALSRPKAGEPWALGRSRRCFRVATTVLRRRADGWDQVFEVSQRLDSIGVLGDGAVLAVGESVSVLFDDGHSTIGSGLLGCRRVWGPSLDRANALSSHGVFHFNGRSWLLVVPSRPQWQWADGDSNSKGQGWIVGMYGSHSCMASGSGSNWCSDGCSSWYLYHVDVAEDGSALAAGGDGLWRRAGGEWVEADGGHDVSRLPLALSAAGPAPICVACRLRDLLRESDAGTRLQGRLNLEVWTGDVWRTIPAPLDSEEPTSERLVVDARGRLFLASGNSVWESTPLTRA